MKALAFLVSFLLAFLLFAVQPMATKMVLPTLGGTPAVWNTAMFTFQFLLLAGYAYAHLLVAQVAPRWQGRVHGLVLLASLVLLPLAVTLPTSDAMLAHPIPYLVAAFGLQIGLPFFALAATQPLLQAWLVRSSHPLARTPYVLYSASNLGSFAGLLGYIALAEPLMSLRAQSVGWSALYVLGMALLMGVAWRLRQNPAVVAVATEKTAMISPSWKTYVLWVFLAFLPSSLSLGVTTYIATDVASVPLLWVLPLSIYLLSFVDAFRTRPILVRACQYIAPLMALTALLMYGLQLHRYAFGFPFHLLTFAVMAFALHGWLAKTKPDATWLTRFYLCMSVGGALGGVLNGLLAPMLLKEALEYPAVLLLASFTSFLLLQQQTGEGWLRRQLMSAALVVAQVMGFAAALYVVIMYVAPPVESAGIDSQTLMMSTSFAAMICLALHRRYVKAYYACVGVVIVMQVAIVNGAVGHATLFMDRNFFGVERIYKNVAQNAHIMMHDTTMHGMESLKPGGSTQPLSYYWALGQIFDALPVMREHPMAAIGLGVGTMKCHARADQQVDFFEINPMVKRLAEDARYFHQLRDCPGSYRVLLGDGRIRLAQQPDAHYGAIVLDAFSSDAIPAHLLTQEALAMYLRKLAPHGVLLIHTTNRHLNLWPLIGAHAEAMGFTAYGRFFAPPAGDKLRYGSFWVVVGREHEDIVAAVTDEAWEPVRSEGDTPWIDQYINILPYFKALR